MGTISRRRLLRLAGLAALGASLGAFVAGPPTGAQERPAEPPRRNKIREENQRLGSTGWRSKELDHDAQQSAARHTRQPAVPAPADVAGAGAMAPAAALT
jgi:hypothetical protein